MGSCAKKKKFKKNLFEKKREGTWLRGRDPFNQNFQKFWSKTQWIGLVQPEKFQKNRSTFWGGPLFPVGPVGIFVEWIAPRVLPILPSPACHSGKL